MFHKLPNGKPTGLPQKHRALFEQLFLKEFIPLTSMVNLNNRANRQGGVHRIKEEKYHKAKYYQCFGNYFLFLLKYACLQHSF